MSSFAYVIVLLAAESAVLLHAQPPEPKNPCENFCQNGGMCKAPNNIPRCMCPPGFTGRSCESRIFSRDPCMSFVCQNGGKCVSPYDRPICHCPDGTGGVHCETNLPVKPGTCIAFNNPDNGTCVRSCVGDFNCPNNQKCCNTFCERKCTDYIELDPCHGYCVNGGACSAPDDEPVCECPSGYTGRRCELAFTPDPSGSCPDVKLGNQTVCGGTFCDTEAQCRTGQKCCPSACGRKLCTNTGVPASIPPPITCADVMCKSGSICRHVATCSTCPIEPRCIPQVQVGKGLDDHCRRQNYFEVVLLEDSKNSSSYNQLKCSGQSCTPNCTCPSGSTCVGEQAGEKLCCKGKIGLVVPKEKPGVCPSGDFSVCGGVPCEYDIDCTGDQKCCSGCGELCTSPVNISQEVSCGDGKCMSGEQCAFKEPYCPPNGNCFRALIPVCFPLGCAKCSVREQCRLTRNGYECYLINPIDKCGRCPPRQICKTSDIKCVTTPCPGFTCVPFQN